MNKFIFTIVVFFAALVGCSNDKTETGAIKLVLTSDKTVIIADGTARIEFTVKDDKGADRTAECTFFVNANELQANTFSTTTAGEYKAVAKLAAATSNELTVNAVNAKTNATVKVSKPRIISDGGDIVTLSLIDDNNVDVSDLGEFYADGVKITTGRYYSTTVDGIHKITAKFNGNDVTGSASIVTFKIAAIDLVNRVLIESFTQTACPNCPSTIKELDPLVAKNDQLVLLNIHTNGSMFAEDKCSAEFRTAAAEIHKNYYGQLGEPNVFLNRVKGESWRPTVVGGNHSGPNYILGTIKSKCDVGIAIVSSVEGKTLKVKAQIGSKKTFAGKAVAVLVENGVMAEQLSMGRIEMYRMVREFRPNVYGQAVSVTAGAVTPFNIDIPLGDAIVKANCYVVVFVTNADGIVENVQQSQLGVSIGY